jgi:hypothetical protein
MVRRSLNVFENFADIVGGSAGFTKTGYLMGVPERDFAALKKVVAMQQQMGINTRLITPEEIREIEPRTRVEDFVGGAWEPDSGYADPSDTTSSFIRRARELGVQLHQGTEVVGLKLTGGAVTEVVTNQGNFSTPTVVDAAGAWGDRIAAMVEIAIPLTVCRHTICFVKRPSESAARHPMLYDFVSQIYTRPEGQDLTLVGSLDPIEISRDMGPIMEALRPKKLPIMLPTGSTGFKGNLSYIYNPIWVDELAGNFPDVPIVMAKMGRSIRASFDACLTIAKRNANIYFDLTETNEVHLREAIDQIGAHRIMFGTDLHGLSVNYAYEHGFHTVDGAHPTDEEREWIAWRTADTLYQLGLGG